MLKTKPCRYCEAEVMWWQTPAGAWQLFEPRPVPFTPILRGIALHKRRGWTDAAAAWPEPSEMFPQHQCHRYEMTLALSEKGMQRFGVDLDQWLAVNDPSLTPTPRRKAAPRRTKRHAS